MVKVMEEFKMFDDIKGFGAKVIVCSCSSAMMRVEFDPFLDTLISDCKLRGGNYASPSRNFFHADLQRHRGHENLNGRLTGALYGFRGSPFLGRALVASCFRRTLRAWPTKGPWSS